MLTLDLPEVQAFMQEQAYQDQKVQRFRSGDELVIAMNPGFTVNESVQREYLLGNTKNPLRSTTKDSRISISYLTELVSI